MGLELAIAACNAVIVLAVLAAAAAVGCALTGRGWWA